MAELRKDILLHADPNQVWAAVRQFPQGGADFRFDEGHVDGDASIDDDLRTIAYAPAGGAEARLQVQGSSGGYCRVVWTLTVTSPAADLDERLSAMAEAMFQALAPLSTPFEPPPAPPGPRFPGFPPRPGFPTPR
jgi:hypothetical protein